MMPFLAASDPDLTGGAEFWRNILPFKNQIGVLLGAIAFVIIATLVWAIFFRKRPDDTSRRYSYRRMRDLEADSSAASVASSDSCVPVDGNSSPVKKKRRRKRRRPHRPRNPTLAETGGLPPVRADGLPDDP